MGDQASKAYVIAVSYGKGCYRHIKISADLTLEELSASILDAFEFDNDHLHAFFMDNKAWSRTESYYMLPYFSEEEHDDERHTCDYTLKNVGVTPGKKFLYLFDYGDEWRFSCRVLKELEEKVEITEVIKVVGDPPLQYGEAEDEEWDEEGEEE